MKTRSAVKRELQSQMHPRNQPNGEQGGDANGGDGKDYTEEVARHHRTQHIMAAKRARRSTSSASLSLPAPTSPVMQMSDYRSAEGQSGTTNAMPSTSRAGNCNGISQRRVLKYFFDFSSHPTTILSSPPEKDVILLRRLLQLPPGDLHRLQSSAEHLHCRSDALYLCTPPSSQRLCASGNAAT